LEENGLWKRLKKVEEWEWEIIDHALDRLKQKGIQANRQDILSTIHNATLIEYKIDRDDKRQPDERVVLRSKVTVNRHYNLHAVYSLTNKRIISVWMNKIDDRHRTLNWDLYDKTMKVFGI
jgi:hypothetical protein